MTVKDVINHCYNMSDNINIVIGVPRNIGDFDFVNLRVSDISELFDKEISCFEFLDDEGRELFNADVLFILHHKYR